MKKLKPNYNYKINRTCYLIKNGYIILSKGTILQTNNRGTIIIPHVVNGNNNMCIYINSNYLIEDSPLKTDCNNCKYCKGNTDEAIIIDDICDHDPIPESKSIDISMGDMEAYCPYFIQA